MTDKNLPSGSLQVRVRNGTPRFIAHWRFAGSQHQATLGKAWMVEDSDGGWKKKRGKPSDGYLTRDQAIVKKASVIQAAAQAQRVRTDKKHSTFAEAAEDWFQHVEHTVRAKPSTLTDYRLLLSQPVARLRGKGERDARIMRQFGRKKLASISTADVTVFLADLDRAGMSARSVNKHRQILHSIFAYCSEPGSEYGLDQNPVSATKKRQEKNREGGLERLETFSYEEVQAIVRAAEDGKVNKKPGEQYGPETHAEWERLNRQDAALFLVAAQTGLRRGELCALQWQDVNIAKKSLIVCRAISGKEVQTPKSGKKRSIGLSGEAAQRLAELGQRDRYTRNTDFVFCNTRGGFLDGRQLGRRFKKAQESAGIEYRTFHALRHTFGSELIAKGFSLRDVQALMGHSSITTTERYLHSSDLSELADRMTVAFTPETIDPQASHSIGAGR